MRLEGHRALVLAGFGGFARLLVEMFLHAEGLLALDADEALRTAVREQPGSLGVVLEKGLEDADEAALEGRFLDRDHQLDALFQVARHPVGRGDVHLAAAAVVEMEEPGMFEEAVDDGDDLDVFRILGIAGLEAADAAHVQADFHAGLRRLVKRMDEFRILQGIHLRDDAGGEPLFRSLGLAGDEVQQRGLHRRRRGHEALEAQQLRTTGDGVEEQ